MVKFIRVMDPVTGRVSSLEYDPANPCYLRVIGVLPHGQYLYLTPYYLEKLVSVLQSEEFRAASLGATEDQNA